MPSASVFDGKGHVAEGTPARLRGLVRWKTVTLQRLLPERAMRLDLLAQIGGMARPAKEVQQPLEDVVHQSHQRMMGAYEMAGGLSTPINS